MIFTIKISVVMPEFTCFLAMPQGVGGEKMEA